MVEDQYEVGVETKSALKLDWIVKNNGNVDLTGLIIEDSLVGSIKLPDLPAGKPVRRSRNIKASDKPRPIFGLSTVKGLGPKKNSVGPISSVVKINVVEPVVGGPIVKIYSPPKQDPVYTTMDTKMPVWGYVESEAEIVEVMINDKTLRKKCRKIKGGCWFETAIAEEVMLKQNGETKITVVAKDDKGRTGSDQVIVRHASSPYTREEKGPGALRVIKRVKTETLENYHERVSAKPDETVQYRIRIINAGKTDLEEVTLGDIDLVQIYSDKKKQEGDGLVLPPSPPFELKAKKEKTIDFDYKIPKTSAGGLIANHVFVGARDKANKKPYTATDQAQVLVDGPPIEGDPGGGLILNPSIILLSDTKNPPPKGVTRQLEVLRVSDAVDVTRSANTKYQTLKDILGPLHTTGLDKKIEEKIRKLLGSYKLDAAGKFGTIGIPPRAVIEIDRTGKLKAKKNGFNIIRAVHTMPNGDVKYSNYALVIVGIGSIAGIDIQPRSFSFLRTSGCSVSRQSDLRAASKEVRGAP